MLPHQSWCQTNVYKRESDCTCKGYKPEPVADWGREGLETPTPKLDKLMSTPTPWDGAGPMIVTVTFMDGESDVFPNIHCDSPRMRPDGSFTMETYNSESRDVRTYTLYGVRYWSSITDEASEASWQ